MKPIKIHEALASLAILASSVSHAVPEQVGDFRAAPDAYEGFFTVFDPGFVVTTRDVGGAPFQLPSVLTAVTQQPTISFPGDASTDIGIMTDGFATTLKNVNRFGTTTASDPGKVGAFQYSIDLSPLENYLTTNSETLILLDLQLVSLLGANAQDKPYDIYLSYTNGTEGITLTPISPDDPNLNFTNFWLPSQSGAVGDVIGGTHKIVSLGAVGNVNLTEDLLALYASGIRELNFIVMVPSFFSGRTFTIEDTSGIHFETSEGSVGQVGDFRMNPKLYPSFYHADQLGPLTTQPVAGALFDLPSVFTATSQNQGGNPEPSVVQPTTIYSLDGNGGGTTSFDGNQATVTGFGADGIGAGSSDGFELVAWQDSGDFSVDVRLASFNSLQAGARAGIMVRASTAADSAHVFVGVQQSGEPVVVVRDGDGNPATESLGSSGSFPLWLRVTRAGDGFAFFTSIDGIIYSPAPLASASVAFADPVLVGLATTSGSDTDDAIAVFEEVSETLPHSVNDLSLRTYFGTTVVRTLNRFASEIVGDGSAGSMQWEIDLAPLEGYLTANSLNLDSLGLELLTDPSDDGKPFDVYLSYDDPSESIELSSVSPDNSAINKEMFFDPSVGAMNGDFIGGTHKVIAAGAAGDLSLSEDLLVLYNNGVRKLNLIIMSNQFYRDRNLGILGGSGIFIETSAGAAPIRITEVSRVGSTLSVTVDGLTNGADYHLGGGPDLSAFPSLPGTGITATGSGDVLTFDSAATSFFVRVLEGAAP